MASPIQRLHLIFTLKDCTHSYSEPSFWTRVSFVHLSVWTWRTERSIRNLWIFSIVSGRQVYWLYFLRVLVKRVWRGQYEVSWYIFIIFRIYCDGWEGKYCGTSYFLEDVLTSGTFWIIVATWWTTNIEYSQEYLKDIFEFVGVKVVFEMYLQMISLGHCDPQLWDVETEEGEKKIVTE